jgi:hypothetical protein
MVDCEQLQLRVPLAPLAVTQVPTHVTCWQNAP